MEYLYIFIFIILAILLYFFLKKTSFVNDSNSKFEFFIKSIKLYMKRYHPKIDINYGIVDLSKNEKNIKVRQTVIIDDIANQFYNYKFIKTTQKAIAKEKLWPTYIDNPPTSSYPNDWLQRKEFAYSRDNKSCTRCGQGLSSLNDVYTSFVRPIKEGGGFNFENILTLCIDCNKVLDSNLQKSASINSLKLYDELLGFIVD